MIENEWETYENDYGTFMEKGNVRLHVEKSQKWHDENPIVEPVPTEPTEIELLSSKVVDLKTRQDTTDPYVERVKTATEIYEENKDKTDLLLDELKRLRIGMLKEECSNAIYNGFEVNGAQFGMNVHDQNNLTQQLLLVVAGQTTPIQWKTKNVGVIDLTVDEFKAVTSAATTHKMNEQAKYWTLEQSITGATDKESVQAITW